MNFDAFRRTLRAIIYRRNGISSLEYVLIAVGVVSLVSGGAAALWTAVHPVFSTSIPGLM